MQYYFEVRRVRQGTLRFTVWESSQQEAGRVALEKAREKSFETTSVLYFSTDAHDDAVVPADGSGLDNLSTSKDSGWHHIWVSKTTEDFATIEIFGNSRSEAELNIFANIATSYFGEGNHAKYAVHTQEVSEPNGRSSSRK